MTMEVPRKRFNTYGKGSRRTLVHDLFNIAQNEPSLYETVRDPAFVSSNPSRTSTPFSDVSEDAETSRQLRQELSAAAHTSDISSRGASPYPNLTTAADASSPSPFDLDSSSGEMKTNKYSDTVKRRKLVSKSSSMRIRDRSSKQPLDITAAVPAAKNKNNAGKTKSDTGMIRKVKPMPKKLARDLREPESEVSNESDQDMLCSVPTTSHFGSSQKSPIDLGSPKSEKSTSSMVSTRGTPKRKREMDEDAASDLSSPSNLELSALRLTPQRRAKARPRSSDASNSDSSLRTPSKNRIRLVDKLDIPTAKPSHTMKVRSVSPQPSKTKKLSLKNNSSLGAQTLVTHSDAERPPLDRGDSGRSDTAAPRPRTYGKQRSHLKDMAAGLESQEKGSSQQSLQNLVSQVESLAASQSQFEIEDDSEAEDSGPKLKSIHELRHAGLANRFDRDIEAIFEDVESGNKSLRLTGLMQLVRRLQEKAFKSHMLESGKLHRLAGLATPDLDLTCSMIFVLALWALAVAETATTQGLSQIYGCLLKLPSSILIEKRAMSSIAKDRKENLSKALIQEVMDFESHVLNKSVRGDRHSNRIIISRVSLRCLEHTLRRIIGLAGRALDPPAQIIGAVIDCIKSNLEEVAGHGERADLVEGIRLLLSWLELTAASCPNVGHVMPPTVLQDLGTALSEVMRWSKHEHHAIEQSSIRTAVELSNGNSAVCQVLASTPLSLMAFDVVEDHFSRLAAKSTVNDPVDGSKLNSVILALGCLLNFADCSETVRTKTMTKAGAGATHADRLVNTFNAFVDQVGEAVTEERTQLLGVPFGYLCLLLCTLCLETPIRSHISATIKGDGLSRLVMEAEICLNHMKVIDSDSFVERFGATIEAVKTSNT